MASENFSYSRLETYENCHYKYHLRYDLKNYINGTNIATLFGTLVHKINELQTNYIISGKKIDYDFLKEYFYKIGTDEMPTAEGRDAVYGVEVLKKNYPTEWTSVDKTGRTYAQKASDFIETGMYRQEEYLKSSPYLYVYAAELPFEFHYDGYCFKGFIDRVLRYRNDEKHFVIHDIKTSAQAYDDKKCVTPLQMVIYCLALKEMFGKDCVVDCFYEFPIAEELKAAGTPGFINRGLKKIDSLISGIKSKDWKPTPSPLCYYCEYSNSNPNIADEGKNMCPYYSLWSPDNRKEFRTFLPWLGIECD